VSGHIASSGGIDVAAGGSITAAISSNSATVSGDASKATVGVQAVQAAAPTKVAEQASDTVDKKNDLAMQNEEDEKKRKKGTGPKLVKYVGRVTVILPGK
jgi:hypothetical protein